MRSALAIALTLTLLMSCKERGQDARVSDQKIKETNQTHVVIRSIDVNIGTAQDVSRGLVGIELNGDRARLIVNPYKNSRQYYDIPYSEGLALLDQFDSIKGVSKHLEKPSDRLYEDYQYIVQHYTYFDTPERHTQDYVSYVYPKKGSISDSDFSDWLAAMQSAREHAEQASAGQPATASESDSDGGDKPEPEVEGRSR